MYRMSLNNPFNSNPNTVKRILDRAPPVPTHTPKTPAEVEEELHRVFSKVPPIPTQLPPPQMDLPPSAPIGSPIRPPAPPASKSAPAPKPVSLKDLNRQRFEQKREALIKANQEQRRAMADLMRAQERLMEEHRRLENKVGTLKRLSDSLKNIFGKKKGGAKRNKTRKNRKAKMA
jgi:hypothetical protein